eukprot:CAMPEP_0175372152 /NCGR_PEP_ID=MMETSP0095-20121207/22082_1 /TAXON_ID=311494 /ORGANISM="Alexandrium monilatum, Strain CCMP3105" /LENGTH=118 /DNA_ID=CAMNT_0016670335 /DNA_START=126 /DNA_END=482 /DNA_ORIENTATION=-
MSRPCCAPRHTASRRSSSSCRPASGRVKTGRAGPEPRSSCRGLPRWKNINETGSVNWNSLMHSWTSRTSTAYMLQAASTSLDTLASSSSAFMQSGWKSSPIRTHTTLAASPITACSRA